jgi:hypothetical protein
MTQSLVILAEYLLSFSQKINAVKKIQIFLSLYTVPTSNRGTPRLLRVPLALLHRQLHQLFWAKLCQTVPKNKISTEVLHLLPRFPLSRAVWPGRSCKRAASPALPVLLPSLPPVGLAGRWRSRAGRGRGRRLAAGRRRPPAAGSLQSGGGRRRGRGAGGVTEPPKIILYYRISRSTWPLSNNKELLSRFRRVKPGKSHTTVSLICAKPTRRRDQSTTLHYIKGSQVRHCYKLGFSYIKVNMNRV